MAKTRRKSVQKQARGGGRRRKVAVPRGLSSSALVSAVCAQTDPFCQHAFGAKIPDSNTTPSVTFTSYSSNLFTVPASGALMSEFSPNMKQMFRNFTINESGAQTDATGWYPIPEHTAVGYGFYRVVSGGVKITCTSNALQAQGVIRLVTNNRAVDTGNYYGTYALDAQTYPNKTGQEIYWVTRPQGIDSQEYVATHVTHSTATNQLNDEPHTILQFWVVGAAEGSTFLVERWWHYELLPDPTTTNSYRLFATQAARDNPRLLSAARNASRALTSSSMAGTRQRVSDYLKGVAIQTLTAGARMALGAVATRYLGPAAGAAAPMIADFGYANIQEVD